MRYGRSATTNGHRVRAADASATRCAVGGASAHPILGSVLVAIFSSIIGRWSCCCCALRIYLFGGHSRNASASNARAHETTHCAALAHLQGHETCPRSGGSCTCTLEIQRYSSFPSTRKFVASIGDASAVYGFASRWQEGCGA
jgi:hypothetical protein